MDDSLLLYLYFQKALIFIIASRLSSKQHGTNSIKLKQFRTWHIIIIHQLNTMEFNREEFSHDGDDHAKQGSSKPNAWRVDGEDSLKEKDLEGRRGDSSRHPVMEGKPMGGHNFGKNNLTPAGDDKNNPSQNAGYSNAYFARNEPSEEHPEDSNFKAQGQDGRPDYSKAQGGNRITGEVPKPEKVERGNGVNDRPHKGGDYQEGTADNESEPGQSQEQQQAGEKVNDDEREHIET